ncbi:MAG: hypothetical protein ACOYXT_07085 [Bacteroidota bacterium]
MRPNILIAAGFLLFGALILATLKPASRQKTWSTENGVVAQMYETSLKDLVLELKGQTKKYYINNGFGKGLSLAVLKDRLLHKEVVIHYPDRFNIIEPGNANRYVAKLEVDGEVIYLESE